ARTESGQGDAFTLPQHLHGNLFRGRRIEQSGAFRQVCLHNPGAWPVERVPYGDGSFLGLYQRLELRPAALDRFINVILCPPNSRPLQSDLVDALVMFGLSGRANIGPRVLVVEQLVPPRVLKLALVWSHLWVKARRRRAHHLGGRNAVLVFTVYCSMCGVRTVPVFPVRAKVTSVDRDLAVPLLLDPCHRRLHGRELEFGPGIFVLRGGNDFTLFMSRGRIFQLRSENDYRVGGVVGPCVSLQKDRESIANGFHLPRASE